MSERGLSPGDIVQINDQERPGLIGALLLVEEVRAWGVQGFIHHINTFNEATRIYLRLKHDQFERVGRAVLVPADLYNESEKR